MKVTSLTKHIFFLLALLVCGTACCVQAQVIATIGNVSLKGGYSGDGASAVYATFDGPRGIAVDRSGNIYIADAANNCIRMIDAFGDATTFAGTGSKGFSGDGGLAIKAEFNTPSYIMIDTIGNIYIADSYNYRVREIDTNGIITTFAGNGKDSYTGDGGQATKAGLYLPPVALTMDTYGNIYIVDNVRVRKVNTSGIISTVVGSGQTGYGGDGGPALGAAFGGLNSAAFDKNGNMFLADATYHVIHKVNPAGTITLYAGNVHTNAEAPVIGDGGPAIDGQIVTPADMKFDKKGNLYITDLGTGRIRKIDANGIISTFAGDGSNQHSGDGLTATQAGIRTPYGIALDTSGDFFITETSNGVGEGANDVRFIFDGEVPATTSLVTAYPNPTFNGVTRLLFTSKYEENVTFTIVSQSGQKVYETSAPTNRPVEVRLEPTGIYSLLGRSQHGKWKCNIAVVRN